MQVSIGNAIRVVKCHSNEQWKRLEYSQRVDDIRLHEFLYQSGPIDHSTLNIDCNSNLKKSDE